MRSLLFHTTMNPISSLPLAMFPPLPQRDITSCAMRAQRDTQHTKQIVVIQQNNKFFLNENSPISTTISSITTTTISSTVGTISSSILKDK
jgi:hypothetical protein